MTTQQQKDSKEIIMRYATAVGAMTFAAVVFYAMVVGLG